MDQFNPQPGIDARIRMLVEEALEQNGKSPPGRDDSLRDAGLTSLQTINLMIAVENAFDVALPESKMTPDHFKSVAAIEALVRSLRIDLDP